MILKGSQRAGGQELARHLLRADENEHVEIHEIRGFLSDDLHGAFREAHAASKGTRAKQFLFSLSLNPPPQEKVPIEIFEAAIETVERRLALDGQPRTIIFHEKDGRRHAHAVWSRIDTQEMKAINLPHYRLKLRDIARDIYLEQGWQLPRGFVSWKERDPLNFSLEEWQQTRRAGLDTKAVKQMFRECWAASDSAKAFAQALRERGFTLAIGDRRGHVAVDYRGKPYAVARYTGQRTKDVKARLGEPDEKRWPPLKKARKDIAENMSAMLRNHIKQAERDHKLRSVSLTFQRNQALQRQRDEREKLQRIQEERRNAETRARAQRLSKGFRGVWDRLTGKHAQIRRQNEREALLSFYRDREEKDGLIFRQIEDRQKLQSRIREEKKKHALDVQRLHRDIVNYKDMRSGRPSDRRERSKQAAETCRTRRGRTRDRGPERDI